MKKPDIKKTKMVAMPHEDASYMQSIENYPYVFVILRKKRKKGSFWSIYIGGDDDAEMIMETPDQDEAVKCFDKIKDMISIRDLKNMGFRFF